MALTLPREAAGAVASLADDATTVVYDGDGDVDVAVQALPSGARIQTVLERASAPSEYTYAFEGLFPELRSDGTVALMIRSADVAIEVATVEAPWAYDAEGVPVPTRYRIDGSALIQEVDHTAGEYTYPIVADPSYSVGRFIYVRYSKAEVKRMAPSAWTARFAAVVCVAIPNPPAAAACAIGVDQYASSIASTFQSAARNNKCVELRFNWVPAMLLTGWNSYTC